MVYWNMTVKISCLILLLSIVSNTQAGERLQGISGSMGNNSNLFSKLFDDDLENKDIDATDKRQHEEITIKTKLEAEHDMASIEDGQPHGGIKDDSTSFPPVQENNLADTLAEIDIISDINGQFEDTINQLQAAEMTPQIKTAQKKPTQLFIHDSVTTPAINENESFQTTNQSNILHAANETATVNTVSKDCVKEKVYSLDVDNAEQYERLEDFPFTYECVIGR